MHTLQDRERAPRRVLVRVGVVVPAHNEAAVIDHCIDSIKRSAALARRNGLEVRIHVVCDACTDGTEQRVAESGLIPILVDKRNVGAARAVGANAALAEGAQWLSFTDADSVVSEAWLIDQLSLGADAFCGTVAVTDWGQYGSHMNDYFLATYRDTEDHRHVHGANFGISAKAYEAVGGFQALSTSEDVALVNALLAAKMHIAWSARPRVTTSARSDYRAPEGFGATLERVAAALRDTTNAQRIALPALLPVSGESIAG